VITACSKGGNGEQDQGISFHSTTNFPAVFYDILKTTWFACCKNLLCFINSHDKLLSY